MLAGASYQHLLWRGIVRLHHVRVHDLEGVARKYIFDEETEDDDATGDVLKTQRLLTSYFNRCNE